MVKISVIVPTCGKSKILHETLRRLKEQDFSDYEIIVVDNAGSKFVKKIVKSENNGITNEKYLIKYIEEPNIGLHNARHTGAKVACGEILVYLDDDLIADKNYLSQIYKVFQEIPNAGWVGGKILPKWDVEPPEWIKSLPTWCLSLYDEGDELKEVQWIYGCIRRNLLFELGGFNPDAFADKKMWWMRGDGEIGLLKKVRNTGKKVIYNPKAILWHFIPKERLTVEYFKERTFKSGIEASFVKYRYKKHNDLLSIFHMGAFFILWFWKTIIGFIDLRAKVRASYFKARFLYEYKWLTNKKLREFVKTKQWLQ